MNSSRISVQATSSTATSIDLSLSLEQGSTPYGINCTTSITNTAADASPDSSVFSSSLCSYYIVGSTASSLTVTGLVPSSSYQCCVQDLEYNQLDCADSRTRESSAGGVSSAVAGVVGGIIGVVITLAVLLAVAGIVFAIIYFRKQQMKR